MGGGIINISSGKVMRSRDHYRIKKFRKWLAVKDGGFKILKNIFLYNKEGIFS